MKTILVTGGTGLLGKGMEETAPEGWNIVSLHQRGYQIEDATALHLVLDIREKKSADKVFADYKFDAVIHAAGIANVDYVETHYAESLESNLEGTFNIASAARRAGVYFVYVSTNAVFDGQHAPYSETDAPNPVNKYGEIKLQCERLISETLTDSSIVRPILMYGWNHAVNRPNIVTWVRRRLQRGEIVELVDDVTENPLYNLQCAEALWAVVEKRPSGVFHVAGKDACNRYEFGRKIAEVFGLDASLITRVDSSRFPDIAKRPPNTTLSVKRMETELGVPALRLEDGLKSMKALMRVKT